MESCAAAMTDVERFGRAAVLRGRWLLSALSFYGDESGSHAASDSVFVLAGYLGSDATWTEFSDRWESALHQSPGIEFLHMREYIKREGQFSPMDRFQAEKKLNVMIDVLRPFLQSRRLREFTALLPWSDFRYAVSGPLKEVRGNPYYFLLRPIIDQVSKFVNEDREWSRFAPVEYFFDDQSAKLEYNVARQFENVKSIAGNARLMGGIAFRNDEWSYPLQAADLIAWERRRRELNLPEDLGGRKTLKRLTAVTEGMLMRVDRDKLRQMSDEMDAAVRDGTLSGMLRED
jgi:hypothetical protein